MMWSHIDWANIFTPGTPLIEIFVRGSVIYLGALVLLRLILRRQSGTVGISDLLVVVLLADAAQNAMADDYRSLPDGLMLVGTIIFWSYATDWLGYHFPPFQRFLYPPPLPLIRAGKMLRHNMRKELVTDDELISQMRQQGIEDLANIREAYMESNGHVSFLLKDGKSRGSADRASF